MQLLNNRYKIVGSIGEGGMANVYLADDTIDNRQVAIKVLRGEMANDPVALVRFQREANAAATLSHPNIVEIYDVGNVNNRHYIVMEYVKGQSLKQLLARRGALPVNEAVYIMRQLTEAIEAAHLKGIIHRDIKPQNVLITADGSIKITDFGIAMAQDALQLTVSDSVMGSVHYLAPELAKGEPASMQSDVYSLGVVFYELLNGDVPFRAETPVQVAIKHLREDMPFIRDVNPNIPQSVENVIIKATAKNKMNRYLNCRDLINALNRCEKQDDVERLDFTKMVDSETGQTVVAPIVKGKMGSKFNRKNKKGTESSDDFYKPKKKSKINFASIIIGTLVAAISIGALMGILFFAGILKLPEKQVEVPSLINLTKDQAETKLTEAGLFLDSAVIYEVTDDVEKDLVFSQTVAAGEKIPEGSLVGVTISEGTWLYIDDYIGQSIADAQQDLVNKQITNVNVLIQTKVDNKVEEGTILDQTGLTPGFKIDPTKEYQLTFVISGYLKVVLPNLVGQEISVAQSTLKSLGVTVKLSQKEIPTDDLGNPIAVETGKVISMSPVGGTTYTQKEGSSVTLSYY